MTTPSTENTSNSMFIHPVMAKLKHKGSMSLPVDIPRMQRIEAFDFGTRSKSIPIRKYIQRTPSELQLCEDEAVADYRDYCMYTRILGGITRQQMKQHDLRQRYQNDQTIESIMRTRHELQGYPCKEDERILTMLEDASTVMDSWEPDLVEIESSNDSEQSDALFELEL